MKKILAGALIGFLVIAVMPAHASNWIVLNPDSHNCEASPMSPLTMEHVFKASNSHISTSIVRDSDGKLAMVIVVVARARVEITRFVFFRSMELCQTTGKETFGGSDELK